MKSILRNKTLIEIMVEAFNISRTEAKRLINQRAVTLNPTRHPDDMEEIELEIHEESNKKQRD